MLKKLVSFASLALLVGCGSAADTLRGDPWKIEKWTYTIDEVFDGSGNMPPSKKTMTGSANNAGTLTFTGGEETEIGGGGQLARMFTQSPRREDPDIKFYPANTSDSISWDPGGVGSTNDDEHIMIYDPNNAAWNGPWMVEGSGDDVTLSRSYQTDWSPTQHMIETTVFHLTR